MVNVMLRGGFRFVVFCPTLSGLSPFLEDLDSLGNSKTAWEKLGRKQKVGDESVKSREICLVWGNSVLSQQLITVIISNNYQ